jgi:hypothetical protein
LALPGVDLRPWFPPRHWFVMLATTRMTKSFKMVLLRVLLDNDAVFSGMPISELAAKCREFLVAHEFLRRDIADAATGQPVEMSPRKWESSWRKFPISIWMQEQEGREWEFRFVKIACNVAGPRGSNVGDTLPNELPTLLREWFGPDAGLFGTSFEVEFHRDGPTWHAAPLGATSEKWRRASSPSNPPSTPADSFPHPLLENPPPRARFTTHVPVYDLTAAAGLWGPESQPEEIGWTEVPGVAVKPGMFVARVTGTSMEPLIPDGSWCLFRPCPAGSREGRIVLVQFAVKRRGRERRPVHREEVPLGAIYRFDRHRRRLAAHFDSAPAAESGVRADHARAGGRQRPHDRRGVCSGRTVRGLRFTTEAARRVVCRA